MQLLDHFSELTVYPENAKKLRELVMQLAVQGKLTESWRASHPELVSGSKSSEALLKKIKDVKTNLVKEGKIKKEKSPPQIGGDEIPYVLPKSWVWCRIGEICIASPRNNVADEIRVGFVPMASISQVFGEKPSFEERLWAEVKSGFTHFQNYDVAFAKITPCFQNSKACVFSNLPNGIGAGTTELHVFRRVIEDLIPEFVYCIFKSPDFLRTGESKMTGSAGQKRVPKDYFINYIIGLPSPEEQKAIVAKVNVLMKEIDFLQQLSVKRIEQKNKFVVSALHHISTTSLQEMNGHWDLLKSNFHNTIDEVDNVKKLRENILQLAVQGKLTRSFREQNPDLISGSNSATALLEKIKDEKAQLIQEGKIKKEKPLLPISVDETPYELPEGWIWSRPQSVFLNIVDCPHSTPKFISDGALCIDTTCMDFEGNIIINKIRKVSIETYHKRNIRLIPQEGDIIYAREGSIGKSVVLPLGIEVCLGQRVMLYRPPNRIDSYYLRICLVSPMFLEMVTANHKGLGAKHVNMSDLRKIPIPIPPLAEQKAIVEKVSQLMSLCDLLEQHITDSQHLAEDLMKSLVREVVEI